MLFDPTPRSDRKASGLKPSHKDLRQRPRAGIRRIGFNAPRSPRRSATPAGNAR
ncbi:hypothetical protein [Lysobacter gummosus]|uniref:hypothetical protein n=1 Tax=Lysobacter gummosus TaxID=262324 RepID=UPI00364515E0